jgi:hypothetical protein
MGGTVIVSHKLGLIFIKTRKTAGTSFEIALSRYAGERDIITPVTAVDEQLRRECGGRGPQNHVLSRAASVRLAADGQPRVAAHALLHPVHLRNHVPAKLVRGVVGKSVWHDYLTVTIERNPWDRAVSWYFWKYGMNSDGGVGARTDPPEFSDFLREHVARLSNIPLYAIDGRVAVDRILRYENLREEIEELWQRVGIPGQPELPRAKGAFRPTRSRDFRCLYSDDDATLVAQACEREIEAMGYSFDPA